MSKVSNALEPTEFIDLSEEQEARLADVLDQYLSQLERSEPVDVEDLKRQHVDLAEVMTLYIDKLNFLVKLPQPFNKATASPAMQGSRQKLGDFILLGEIGRGGMGIVYEAQQISLNRRVAIKLLPLASMLDAHQIARFHNEARAAGLLQHENIVPIYSVGVEQGIHYFAMQFVDGISMDAWIVNQQQIEHGPAIGQCSPVSTAQHIRRSQRSENNNQGDTWRNVVNWGVQIAEALHTAHEAGVVHRDIKPSNVMCDKAGKIWITDFGLARCQTEKSLTRSGDLLGTMRYMSPEQARGQSALIDGRTDIYSLAATLYEMLVLRPAHPGEDAPTLLKMIDQREVTHLRVLRPDLPRDLETVISKAMDKQREERYETALEFAADLTRVLQGEPTWARPASVTDRLYRWVSKHRRGVLASASVVVLGLIGLAITNAQLSLAHQASQASAARAIRGEAIARDAVDKLPQMAELLDGIPGADSVRRQLLSQSLAYYERFAVEFKHAPELRQDIAIALGKIGALQAELGDNLKAIDSLTRSEAIYAELSKHATANDPVLLDWAISQNNLAQALLQIGEIEVAARNFSGAIDTQQRVIAHTTAGKENQGAKLGLATTLNNLGLLLSQSDAVQEAEQAFLQAIALIADEEKLADAAAQTQLAAIRTNLSGLITATSPQRAIECALQALNWQLDALEADRGNAKLATQTIVTLNTLGAAQSAAGQNLAAIATFRRAVEIGQQLLARWPDQPVYRRDMALCQNHLGLSYSKNGELDRARLAFDEALALGRPLAELFASDAETQSMLGGILNNLGFLRQQLGDGQAAAAAYQEAIVHQTLAVKLAPEVQRYLDYLAKHQENYKNLTQKSAHSSISVIDRRAKL